MSFSQYSNLQGTGLPWLGSIPAHWRVAPLKAHLQRNDGGVWGQDPTGEADTLVFRSTEQTVDGRWSIEEPAYRKLSGDERQFALLTEGDLLVTKSSGSSLHIGKTTLVSKEISNMRACYSNFMQRLRVRPTLAPAFAWYLLNNNVGRLQFDLLSNSTIGLANLNGGMIGRLLIPVPPFDEQQIIVNFLEQETSKIDALITEQQRLIELLKEKRQAVISHAVTKGLNPDVRMKPSGVEWLGEVPEHWKVVPVKHLLLPTKGAIKTGPFGSHLTAAEMQTGSIKVYNQRNVIDNDFVSGENFISEEKFAELAAFEVFPGDLVVTTRGTIGRAAIVPAQSDKGILHPCLLRLQLDDSKIYSEFMRVLIQESFLMQTQLSYLSNATTIEVIYSNTMASLIVPLPPLEEQKAILDFITFEAGRFGELSSNATKAVDLLQERRTALISAAVTGKIDVRNYASTQKDAA